MTKRISKEMKKNLTRFLKSAERCIKDYLYAIFQQRQTKAFYLLFKRNALFEIQNQLEFSMRCLVTES